MFLCLCSLLSYSSPVCVPLLDDIGSNYVHLLSAVLGTTNKREYDSFCRAIQNRKAFPLDLSVYVAKSKTDLFNAWLDAGRNWDKCRMIMKRSHVNSNESLSGWIAKSGKDLVTEYGEEKAKSLMERRYASGLYYNSDDFPDDPLERFYYMKKPREMTHREIVNDEATLEGSNNLSNDMVKSLIDESDGIFRSGAMPNDRALASAGQKALLDGVAEGGVQAAPKKKAKKDTEGSEAAKPKTPAENAVELMAAILADSTAARKKSMSLGAVNYAGELSSQLLTYAEKMEKYYKTLQQATTGKVTDESFYSRCFSKIEKERSWFEQASVGGWKRNDMVSNLCPTNFCFFSRYYLCYTYAIYK